MEIVDTSKVKTSDAENDIASVVNMTEKVLDCVVLSVLEKFIEKENSEGFLDKSKLLPNILAEIEQAKKHFKRNLSPENEFDKWVLLKLVRLIEELALKHHTKFHNVVQSLNLEIGFYNAYDQFTLVCKQFVKSKPEFGWHNLLALLCFGSEIALHIIQLGKPGVENYLKRFVRYLVDFVVKEEITTWILSHGGWIAMVNVLDEPDCPERATHLISLMIISSQTNIHWQWLVVAVAVIGLSVGVKIMISKRT